MLTSLRTVPTAEIDNISSIDEAISILDSLTLDLSLVAGNEAMAYSVVDKILKVLVKLFSMILGSLKTSGKTLKNIFTNGSNTELEVTLLYNSLSRIKKLNYSKIREIEVSTFPFKTNDIIPSLEHYFNDLLTINKMKEGLALVQKFNSDLSKSKISDCVSNIERLNMMFNSTTISTTRSYIAKSVQKNTHSVKEPFGSRYDSIQTFVSVIEKTASMKFVIKDSKKTLKFVDDYDKQMGVTIKLAKSSLSDKEKVAILKSFATSMRNIADFFELYGIAAQEYHHVEKNISDVIKAIMR
jgi:hypothetical protein